MFENLGEVVLIHDSLALTADAASRDVADQLNAVEKVFRDAGKVVSRLPVDLNLWNFKKRLQALRPSLVFNLVESLDHSDRLQTIVPLLLEDWRIPFTGSGSAAMLAANHKILSKRIMAEHSLPFPDCCWLEGGNRLRFLPDEPGDKPSDWIVKTLESHASLYLDDDSVLKNAGHNELAARLAESEAMHDCPFFAERFVDGREFNLSVVENADGEPEVMPVAEISFALLPPGKPRIVGYAAKWEEDSPEYQATPRTFDLAPGDAALAAAMGEMALAAWRAFGLAGYARVDFRVDAGGGIYILEANANPCITPDAGLAAAAEKGGLAYEALVGRIVDAALRR